MALCERVVQRSEHAEQPAWGRYLKVDPDSRLVADSLEADWNARLRALDSLQQEHERQRMAEQGLLNEEARSRILALSADFPRVWNDEHTAPLERKRMVALLIQDVMLRAEHNSIRARFRGSRTSLVTVPRPVPMAVTRKTKPEVIVALDRLL